ncbi:Helix-turn-helix domain-containing protein [Chitinophaga eiseniae]|uniref:Helix-turn-helix domain-containing protein n=1 Tax=Chitinophaga eiseniae TaxID=634771 RepID=A0A1T4SX17_9BACT|nr:helix-turn-helix domain-containing protein [Chitinophaga eiseniae]SKA32753.1 Helix-turn-helix domain-containing protein [Chitinophaga eiseniae]
MKAIHQQPISTERHPILSNQIVTVADLRDFREELLAEFKKILKENTGQISKKWLKTNEVRKILGASPGTLQRLRNNGTLPFKKIGGIVYYDADEISKMLHPIQKY